MFLWCVFPQDPSLDPWAFAGRPGAQRIRPSSRRGRARHPRGPAWILAAAVEIPGRVEGSTGGGGRGEHTSRIARGGEIQNSPWAIPAQKPPRELSHAEPLGKDVCAKSLAKKRKVGFSIWGRQKSASGLRFSESPPKTIGGTETLVQIRGLAACFVAD